MHTHTPTLSLPADDFIDVIVGNRVYLKCVYVSDEFLPHFIFQSISLSAQSNDSYTDWIAVSAIIVEIQSLEAS